MLIWTDNKNRKHSFEHAISREDILLRTRRVLLLTLLATLSFANSISLAHHSYAAEFDRNNPTTIEGVVTEVWFRNPHVRYYINVVDENGVEVSWDTRGLSPVKLVRQGWTKDTIKVGDRITMHGHLGLKNKTSLSILEITLADGTVLSSSSVSYDVKEKK
jgi:hypothetical protein